MNKSMAAMAVLVMVGATTGSATELEDLKLQNLVEQKLTNLKTGKVQLSLEDRRLLTIDRVEIQEVTGLENIVGNDFDSVRNPQLSWRAEGLDQGPGRGGIIERYPYPYPYFDLDKALNPGEITLDMIIAIGEKIWTIIEKNKPVVNTSYQAMALLPKGVNDWRQLDGWTTPETRVYRKTYKNFYGMTVVDFLYRVAYTYGGSVEGKGKYIANVEVEPRALDVAWGYKFNAKGEVLNPHNAGTKSAPMAGAELRVNWSVDTVIKHSQSSERFFLRGDGLFKNLTDGTLPAQ